MLPMAMHGVPQPQMGMMMQASPNPGQQQQQQQQHPPPQQPQQQAPPPPPQQQVEKMDNISKVKGLLLPLRESLYLTIRAGAFSLQQNNLADNLKRDAVTHSARFDKHLEDFYAYCDQIELHLKTAMQCMQQTSSAQTYLPGAVTTVRNDSYMPDNPGGPIPYQAYLNTVRVHVQSAKVIHDTLSSAAQNISHAD